MAKEKRSNNLVGGRFKNICVVGLNRVEYLTSDSEESIFSDAWQDVFDDHSKKKTALMFFAPSEIDDQIVDPYAYLSEGGEEDEDMVAATQQTLGDTPLLDLIRMKENKPNSVHFMVAADIIFHWDNDGGYIQPTTAQTWVRDIQQLLKGYPRMAAAKVYTNWDREKLAELEIESYAMQDMPLDTNAWINMPSMQDKYGNAVLGLSILAAIGAFGLLHMQQGQITALNSQIRSVESSMPNVAAMSGISSLLADQESQMRYNALMPLIVKDIASSIETSGMKIEKLEIANPEPRQPPKQLMANITAERKVYRGWLQEEPIAKSILTHSVSMVGVRKPPTGGRFQLEGLIPLNLFQQKVEEIQKKLEESKQVDEPTATEETAS